MGNKNTCVVILSMVKINQYSRKQKFKKIKCLASSLPPPPPPEKKINETLFNSKYITNLTPATSKCNTQKLNSVKSSAVALYNKGTFKKFLKSNILGSASMYD